MKPITNYPYSPELLTSTEWFWNCRTTEEIEKHNLGSVVEELDALLAIVQNNRKLFTMITTTIPTMDGWTSPIKACALASLTLALKPTHAVEIGVWAGRSLLPVAMAMKELKSGLITGIDPYSPQESAKGEYGENEKWWAAQDHKAIKGKFLNFIKRFDLSKQTILIEEPSDDVTFTKPIELLHIDGSHTDQAVRDAERFGKHVPIGGIAVLDDLTWVGGGVLRAIDSLEQMGFVEMLRKTDDGDNWNIMQRMRLT